MRSFHFFICVFIIHGLVLYLFAFLSFFPFSVCSHYRAGSVRGGWLEANWQLATQIISLRKSYIISKHLKILRLCRDIIIYNG